MAIEIVDLPIENGGSFHSYVSLALDPLDQIGAIGADCSKVPVQVNSGAARREGEGGALFFFDAKGLAVQPMVYRSLSCLSCSLSIFLYDQL